MERWDPLMRGLGKGAACCCLDTWKLGPQSLLGGKIATKWPFVGDEKSEPPPPGVERRQLFSHLDAAKGRVNRPAQDSQLVL